MIRLLGLLVAILLILAGIGYYRGWFHAQETNTPDQRTIQMTVDKDKFEQDKAKAEQKVQDLEHK